MHIYNTHCLSDKWYLPLTVLTFGCFPSVLVYIGRRFGTLCQVHLQRLQAIEDGPDSLKSRISSMLPKMERMKARVSLSCLHALVISHYPDIKWPSSHFKCNFAVHILCVCVCVIFQFFYLFCSLFPSSEWHCFRQEYKFNGNQPAPEPVAVLVTTKPTHLSGTSPDVIGDIVGHSTSYEFNSLTFLLWLLPYLYISWRFINLCRTLNFQPHETRILIYIRICRDRHPFIVLCMPCYLVIFK
jgi:hypothetical protein